MDGLKLMSATEFAQKYPAGSYPTWIRVLEKFREEGKLVQGQHWKYHRGPEEKHVPVRVYSERKVLKLCRDMCKQGRCAPFYHYLFQECKDTILSAFEPSSASAPISPKAKQSA